MATVDFTLEDIKVLVRGLIREETPRVVAPLIKHEIEQALIKEREHTRKMIDDSAEEVKQSIADEFSNFWDNNLGPAFDELHHEVKGLKRLVAQHSKDILERHNGAARPHRLKPPFAFARPRIAKRNKNVYNSSP